MKPKKENNPIQAEDQKPPLPGMYPPHEDIYEQFKKESEIDPEDPTHLKTVETPGILNEKGFDEDVSGADLDIPGAELDDSSEEIGSEDEENNYYSLGGDKD